MKLMGRYRCEAIATNTRYLLIKPFYNQNISAVTPREISSVFDYL
ncbi:MAG: hypothetical protein AB4080_26795 [Trichodesmium sp.]